MQISELLQRRPSSSSPRALAHSKTILSTIFVGDLVTKVSFLSRVRCSWRVRVGRTDCVCVCVL